MAKDNTLLFTLVYELLQTNNSFKIILQFQKKKTMLPNFISKTNHFANLLFVQISFMIP